MNAPTAMPAKGGSYHMAGAIGFAVSPMLFLLWLMARGLAPSTVAIGGAAMVVIFGLLRLIRREPLLYAWTEPLFGIDADEVVHLVDGRVNVEAKLAEMGPHAVRRMVVHGVAIFAAWMVFMLAIVVIGEPRAGNGVTAASLLIVMSLLGLELVERGLAFRRWQQRTGGRLLPSRLVVYALALYARDHNGMVAPASVPMKELSNSTGQRIVLDRPDRGLGA